MVADDEGEIGLRRMESSLLEWHYSLEAKCL